MIQTAVANIISPTVTAEDKLILLRSIILIFKKIYFSIISFTIKLCIFKSSNKSITCFCISSGIIISIKPSLNLICNRSIKKNLCIICKSFTNLLLSKHHTIAKFSIIFKQ